MDGSRPVRTGSGARAGGGGLSSRGGSLTRAATVHRCTIFDMGRGKQRGRGSLSARSHGQEHGDELQQRQRGSPLSRQWRGIASMILWPANLVEKVRQEVLILLIGSNCVKQWWINAHGNLLRGLGFEVFADENSKQNVHYLYGFLSHVVGKAEYYRFYP
jgi:hypothetical protein